VTAILDLPADLPERVTPRGERLGPDASPLATRYVTAAELAQILGVTRDFVYSHAAELGAVRLGTGPRARLRFDPESVVERLTTCETGRESPAAQTPTVMPIHRRRHRPGLGTDVDLLPIKGAAASGSAR
jgi:hypothetical protein